MKFMSVLRYIIAFVFFVFGVVSHAAMPKFPETVFTFDARPLNRANLHVATNAARLWDTLHAVAALQGIVNRTTPHFYLFYNEQFGVDTDQFWFDWFRGEDGWLKPASIKSLDSLEQVVCQFKPFIKGVVVYDPNVPATSNLASTAAGCDDLLPVRYDPAPESIYTLLVQKMKLPVQLWLVNRDGSAMFTGKGSIPGSEEPSSGSAKVDCYRWAIKHYLPKCGKGIAAYYIDSFWLKHPGRSGPTMHTLSNHDYFIAKKAFFFDLSPWGDELPNDDLTAPLGLERVAFLEVMKAISTHSHQSIIQVGGFPPWPFKYTQDSVKPVGKHDGVATEWEFGRLISQFNGYMEADAAGLSAMANASFYQHYPLPARMPQPNPKPSLAQWKARGLVGADQKVAAKFYVGHYVGDYDSPAWLYKMVPAYFPNPARGKVPMGWAFDPNLADRASQVFVYAYKHATTNDFFIAGDSGAGYLNPRALTVRPDSGLPSGLKLWTEHCQRYFNRFGMSITGFMLDGSGGTSTELEFAAYKTFSPDGVGTHYEKKPGVHEGVASCPELDLPNDPAKAAEVIANLAKSQKEGPGFLWARSILRTPDWYADLSGILAKKYPDLAVEVVDPYTFFGLIRLSCK